MAVPCTHTPCCLHHPMMAPGRPSAPAAAGAAAPDPAPDEPAQTKSELVGAAPYCSCVLYFSCPATAVATTKDRGSTVTCNSTAARARSAGLGCGGGRAPLLPPILRDLFIRAPSSSAAPVRSGRWSKHPAGGQHGRQCSDRNWHTAHAQCEGVTTLFSMVPVCGRYLTPLCSPSISLMMARPSSAPGCWSCAWRLKSRSWSLTPEEVGMGEGGRAGVEQVSQEQIEVTDT